MCNRSRFTRTTTASVLALALVVATASASAAQQKTVTGSLIPVPALKTVRITSPSMAMIRAIAIRPIVTPLVNGKCAVTGAVYSDVLEVADGPIPRIHTALIGNNGQRIAVETNYTGVYHTIVSAGSWREARPQVGTLPFGIHPTRPRFECD